VPDRTTLSTEVAVELAHALVADVAARSECRVLFIKGPVAVEQRLRPERSSTDADVWVDPRRQTTLIDALARHGWRRRPLPDGPRILESHSVTLLHHNWPCDIDVHRYFPGLLAGDSELFDLLWDRRQDVVIAGRPVPACDRLASSLVLAAHQLRDFTSVRNRSEYEWLVDELRGTLSDRDRTELRQLARDTGTTDSLRRFLLDIEIAPPQGPTTGEYERQLREWRMRASSNTPTSRWLFTIRRARWVERPRVMWRALFLPGDLLDQLHPEVGDNAVDRARARITRLGRGARALAPSLATAIRTRRDHEVTREH